MRLSTLKISPLWLMLSVLISCQRTWHARPVLQKTSLGVSAKIPADDLAEKTIAPYRAQVSRQMAEVIGLASVTLQKTAIESPAGNFLADLLRMQAEKITGKTVDIGLMTAGGIRAQLRQGNITVGDIFELMPFENELMVITVPASSVLKLLNYASQPLVYTNPAKVISTGNVTYEIENNKPMHVMIGGLPLDSTRTYSIALSDYLAKGGDNLDFITNQQSDQQVGILVREAIIKQIKELSAEGKSIDVQVDGRVKVVVPEPVSPVSTPISTPKKPKQ